MAPYFSRTAHGRDSSSANSTMQGWQSRQAAHPASQSSRQAAPPAGGRPASTKPHAPRRPCNSPRGHRQWQTLQRHTVCVINRQSEHAVGLPACLPINRFNQHELADDRSYAVVRHIQAAQEPLNIIDHANHTYCGCALLHTAARPTQAPACSCNDDAAH